MRYHSLLPTLSILFVLNACEKDENKDTAPEVFTSNGNIITRVDQFRQALGELNTQPGATTGRREISWESVPDDMLDKSLPAQFFNQTGADASAALQKGITYDPGLDFRVSKTGFASIDPEAAGQFKAFSGSAVFARVGDQPQPWPISFQVAGSMDAAAVRGFGMVVNDVDVAGSVKIDFFNGTALIGSVDVPARTADSPFSFAGLLFKEPMITSIRVTHQGLLKAGEKDISQGGTNDLVVMDDFIYAEPVRK